MQSTRKMNECACGCGATEDLRAFKGLDGTILYSLDGISPHVWSQGYREHARLVHEGILHRKRKKKEEEEMAARAALQATMKYSIVPSDAEGCTWRYQIEAFVDEPADMSRVKFVDLKMGTSSFGSASNWNHWGMRWIHWIKPQSIGVYGDAPDKSRHTGFIAEGKVLAPGKKLDFQLPFEQGQKIYVKAIRDHRECVKSALDDVNVARNLHVIVLQYTGLANLTESSRKYNV